MHKVPLIASKALTYATRRLRAGDTFQATRQDARVLVAVGFAREDTKPAPKQVSKPVPAQDELAALRDEFKALTGRRPHHTWTAARIREAIASRNEAGQ